MTPNLPPLPTEVAEFREAMTAYTLAAAHWLGLDPEQTFRLDVDDSAVHGSPNYGPPEVRASWEAMTQQEPRVGHWTWGMRGDGETVIFSGEVVVTYPESATFVTEVGEKPQPQWPKNMPAG